MSLHLPPSFTASFLSKISPHETHPSSAQLLFSPFPCEPTRQVFVLLVLSRSQMIFTLLYPMLHSYPHFYLLYQHHRPREFFLKYSVTWDSGEWCFGTFPISQDTTRFVSWASLFFQNWNFGMTQSQSTICTHSLCDPVSWLLVSSTTDNFQISVSSPGPFPGLQICIIPICVSNSHLQINQKTKF